MRRIALALAAVGMLAAAGIAVSPAQAYEGWWGGPQRHEQAWRDHEWREHHIWRAVAFERHVLPRVVYSLFHRY
jgi:hypothetical protein